ncbi:STM0539 family protein [Klebsiella michiganensis]|uniref:STM0539 family protein n=1 Tax=Klebsiella michiganensis TaxID=1134687 RepID=UPI0011E8619A|nr:STM0539 family protein [Klebsiella michiganensis]TXV09100.1 hypothetical protein D4M92_00770 [Klebsiella michiganensis]HDS8139101.1 STM0539 family protein [Klebsiella michiganensis]HDT1975876.1 STM0539 family protein [Klebsiella michiganensis]HDV9730512.1 STM0539 family protein [Klebsiella michiganensis]HDV9799645.1 STM0539 family protein [Klebsiella michiganensis]
MRKFILTAAMALYTFSSACHSEELSASGWYAASSAAVSIGSSALVSGIILSPVLLPVSLIMTSVEKDKKKKTAQLKAQDPDKKQVQMTVPLKVVEDGDLKAGDKIVLKKAPEGTGAYLKKEGKTLAHMVNQDDSALSSNQPLSAK